MGLKGFDYLISNGMVPMDNIAFEIIFSNAFKLPTKYRNLEA